MATITRKIELYIDKSNLTDDEYKAQWQYIRQIDNTLFLAANRISSHCLLNDELEIRLKLQMPEYCEIEKSLRNSKKNKLSKEEISELKLRRKELDAVVKRQKEEFLKTSQNSTYQLVAYEFTNIPTEILTNLNNDIVGKYGKARLDIIKGIKSPSTYKKGIPIPFSVNKKSPFVFIDGDLEWFKGKTKETTGKILRFKLHFGKDKSNNRAIVERLVESAKLGKKKGEAYIVNNSSIQLVEKENTTKIFLLLSLDIPTTKRALDSNLVMGIDLGINYPIYYATNGNAYIKGHIGDRDSFLNERMVFQRRFRELQRLQCTQGGRGRLKKLAPLEKLREKERNWVRTKNHIFSREIIKCALKIGAGTIHLEKLKNIGKDKDGNIEDSKKYILRNWSYHELQEMIEYKAAMEGITVKYVNPAYTSQTCSCCGNRGERISQSVFKCLCPECSEYGKEVNADYNAARNIAKSEIFVKK
ncbi:MAG: transposase [Bacteroidaceae bacterium]|nr:transposase [Bacteroidaceae bacterium]